jgi:hypothetical protein
MLVQNQACAPATNPSILNFSQDSDIFVAYEANAKKRQMKQEIEFQEKRQRK